MTSKFYSLKKIDSTESIYRLIIGKRSNGKSYAMKKKAIKNYWENGKQTAWLRRWAEDLTPKRCKTMFSSLEKNCEIDKITKSKWDRVEYISGAWYLARYDDDLQKVVPDTVPFMIGFAISRMEHEKDSDYPNINVIVFDEFISRNYYLINEFVLFMNVLSTIIRDRDDVVIYMLGNSVTKNCLYFTEMGLKNIYKQKQGTIDIYIFGNSTIAVEICGETGSTKKSDKYFAFDNPALEMITSGAWELGVYPHLNTEYNSKDIAFIFCVKYRGDVLQCDFVLKDAPFVYIHKKTTPIKDKTIVYCLTPNNNPYYTTNFFYPRNKLERIILRAYSEHRFFYQDNEVGELFFDFIKNNKK